LFLPAYNETSYEKGENNVKRNRYILCLLFAAFLLYFAVPKFSIFAEGLGGIFTISWLVLALLVVAGNLSAILYSPKLVKTRNPVRREKDRNMKSHGV
jgi:hypothetical protein